MTETVQGRVPQEEIEEALKEVIDPELGVNIVDLGLLYGLRWDEDGTLILDLTLTTAACPLQEVIEEQVQSNLDNLVDSWRVNQLSLSYYLAQHEASLIEIVKL